MRQVFNNLIGNALKFAREGVVEASLKACIDGDRIKVEGAVRDKGPGIPRTGWPACSTCRPRP